MTAAYRLRGLGWLATCTVIVLGFYLVSLQVASERNKLEGLNRKIASAERDIRALETEFDTRANLQQLEKWNGDILALSAPMAAQFVGDEAQLAAVNLGRAPQPTPGQPEMKTAALVVPSLPTAAPVPAIQVAAVAPAEPAPAPKPSAAARLVQAAQAIVRRAPATKAEPSVQKVAMLERGLISESTLGDILSGARAEARRR